MALPNPPVKRKKIKGTGVWLCTDESETLTTNGAKVYTWDGTGLCFGEIFGPGQVECEDDSFVDIDEEGKVIYS